MIKEIRKIDTMYCLVFLRMKDKKQVEDLLLRQNFDFSFHEEDLRRPYEDYHFVWIIEFHNKESEIFFKLKYGDLFAKW